MIPQAKPNVTPRVSASLILLGTLTLGVMGAIAVPLALTGVATTAAAPARPPVRVVDAPRLTGDCAAQTWPYLAAHCLTRTSNSPAAEPNPAPSPVARVEPAPAPRQTQTALAEQPAQAVPKPPAPAPATPAATNSLAVALPATALPVTALPAPPGAEPRPAGDRLALAPTGDAALATGLVATGAAAAALENSKAQPRAERRRKATRSNRGVGLFGYRVVRLPF